VDPSGAAVVRAVVSIHNPLSDYRQSAITAADGSFRLVNIPPNQYHLEVRASSFAIFSQDVTIRKLRASADQGGTGDRRGRDNGNRGASGADLLEVNPSDHVDADRAQLSKLPAFDPGGGLSQAITYSTAVWPPMATDSSTHSAITRRPAL